MIPVKENHKAKRKEMSAIQSFFVLCITEKIKKSKVLFYQKKSGETHRFILSTKRTNPMNQSF